jgi:hypothetical protein
MLARKYIEPGPFNPPQFRICVNVAPPRNHSGFQSISFASDQFVSGKNCVRGVHEFSQSAGHKDESIMTPPPSNRHAAVNEAAET